MQTLRSDNFTVEVGSILEGSFSELLETTYKDSRIVIIVDENTHDNCLEFLLTSFERLQDAEVMLLPAGEENKVMEVCFQVWESLTEYNIGRKDLVINVGGGVVTDMGGFIAAVYKRGLDFINIPTTLLAMVDASVGGKTGIDLGAYKNQLGVFQHPKYIFVDPAFLETLPTEELMNGFAEMLKHALISSKEDWDTLKELSSIDDVINSDLIFASLRVKFDVVEKDPTEKGLRKILNLGHTIGHGIEGFLLDKAPIAHGHAVAMGVVAESYIARKKGLLAKEQQLEIEFCITSKYPMVFLDEEAISKVIELTHHDKKNSSNQVLAAILTEIGSCSFDIAISDSEMHDALVYLNRFAQLN